MLKVIYNTHIYWHVFAVLLVPLLLSVVFVGSAHAETVDYNVYVKPSLKILISSNPVVLNLNPNSKPFSTADINITVGTNNINGYKLYMNTDNDVTSLERDAASDNVTASIDTLSNSNDPCSTTYTESNFTANSWGYRINNASGGESNCIDATGNNYYGYTPNTLISSSDTFVNDKTTNLTFASKIDYNKPAGQYALTLKMKALPIITTYYMQDATSSTVADAICTNEPTVVIDSRDEHPYTVQKLPDNNCWMTTNLDLAGGTTLTPTDSNVSANYTLPASETIASGTTLANPSAFTDDNTAYVFNSNGTTCGENSPCYSYYSYAAATAGTNPSSGDATSDICPKGWRLPTQAEYTTLKNTYTTGATLTAAPFVGVYAGLYDGGPLGLGGYYAHYWSSAASSASDACNFYFGSSYAGVYLNGKRLGGSVRCVLKNLNSV